MIWELLARASRELSDTDRDLLIKDIKTTLAYYDSLLAEQPDPGAAAVLSEEIGPDILFIREVMIELSLRSRREPPYAKAVRRALTVALATGVPPEDTLDSHILPILRAHDKKAKKGHLIGHLVLPVGVMLSFERAEIAELRERVTAALRGTWAVVQVRLHKKPAFAAFVSDGSGYPVPHSRHETLPKYEIVYLDMVMRELAVLKQEIRQTVINQLHQQTVVLYSLKSDETFTWLDIGNSIYSNATITAISAVGILDIVLRKRGSARRYPMKIGANDFVAAWTPQTQRSNRR